MVKHLSLRNKEVLSLILGSVLQEVTEDFEENYDETKEEAFKKMQDQLFEMINILNKKHNLTIDQYLFAAVVVLNGTKNLNSIISNIEKDEETDERNEILSELSEEVRLYENVLLAISEAVRDADKKERGKNENI